MALTSPDEVSTTAARPSVALIAYRMATACFWLKPMSMSLWWTWPRSGLMGLRPAATRRMMALAVSKIGRPRIRNGTANEITA